MSLWTKPADARWLTWPPGGAPLYLHGVNYPYCVYGCDFGSNADGAVGVSQEATRQQVQGDFVAMAKLGIQVARWFVFADGRSGITFDDQDRATGLEHAVFEDLEAATTIADGQGIRLVLVLLDYHFGRPRDPRGNGAVQRGGHRRALADQGSYLVDNVFAPLFDYFKDNTTILAWDVLNEPERLLTQADKGQLANGDASAVPVVKVQQLITQTIQARETAGAKSLITVGAYSMHSRDLWKDLGLDFFEFHYDDQAMAGGSDADPFAAGQKPATFTKPTFIGSLPATSTADAAWDLEAQIKKVYDAGFAGGWPWKFHTTDAEQEPTDLADYGWIDGFVGLESAMANARNHGEAAVAEAPALRTDAGTDRWFLQFVSSAKGAPAGWPWGENTLMAQRSKATENAKLTPTNPIAAVPAPAWDEHCSVKAYLNSYEVMSAIRNDLTTVINAGNPGYVLIADWRLNAQRDLSVVGGPNAWGAGPWNDYLTTGAASDDTVMGLLLRLMQKGVRVRVLLWYPTAWSIFGGFRPHMFGHAWICEVIDRESKRVTRSGEDPRGIVGLDLRVNGIFGSHHQKMMVIRSGPVNAAYCGGVDLAFTRRDAPAGAAGLVADSLLAGDWQSGEHIPPPSDLWPFQNGVNYSSVQSAPNWDVPFGPDLPIDVYGRKQQWFDRHLRVEGPIVATLADQFRERWIDASRTYSAWRDNYRTDQVIFSTPDALDADGSPKDPVPNQLMNTVPATNEDSKVQMWRTMPFRPWRADCGPSTPFRTRGEFTIMAGIANAIRASNELIWICDQYFWSLPLARLLNQRVRETSGGEGERGVNVLILLPPHADDHVERQHSARRLALHEVYRGLTPAQRGRVAVYNLWNRHRPADDPDAPNPGELGIYVHAKAMSCDGSLLVCGSANLNRRSLTNDTELDLAVLDSTLVGEHLKKFWKLLLATPWPTDLSGLDTAGSGSLFLQRFRTAAANAASFLIPDPFDDPVPTLPNGVRRSDDPGWYFPAFFNQFFYDDIMDPCSIDIDGLEVDVVEQKKPPRPPRLDDIVSKLINKSVWRR